MPYMNRLLSSSATRAFVEAGKPGALVAMVAHDKWCKLLRGKGECNCNPTITYRDASGPIADPNEQG